ncbi:MAG: hypothetical protein NTY80_02300 [candidate division SR1 bacterium]|nr:hypothetical protein [candidate division SR1 bacterium]
MNYKLEEILKAAQSFSTEDTGQAQLEASLRKIEAEKTKVAEGFIIEVSYETLCEAINGLSMCGQETVIVILNKFRSLGYVEITDTEPKK